MRYLTNNITAEENKLCVNITDLNDSCPFCGSDVKFHGIDKVNCKFIQEVNNDDNLNDAITLARIVWNNFPKLRLTADSKAIIDGLLQNIQHDVQTILSPIDVITKNVVPLIQRLKELTDSLPDNIKQEFADVNTEIAKKLQTFEEASSKATDPVQKQVKDLADTINELINKPTTKGKAGEILLGDCWQETFIKDKVEVFGGPGQSDIVVVPYLADFQTYGKRIVVERKTGKQKYSGSHLEKAINHAKAENALYVILTYDDQDNLTTTQKPFYLTIHDGVFVAITDIESGGWRTAREVFEAFQAITNDNEETKEDFDFNKIHRTIEEMQEINKIIEDLTRNNNSSIKSSERVRDNITKLETKITNYRLKLKELLTQ